MVGTGAQGSSSSRDDAHSGGGSLAAGIRSVVSHSVSRTPLHASFGARACPARRALTALLIAIVAASCDGERTTITGTIGAPRPSNPVTGGTGTTTSPLDPRLLGRWSSTVLFQDGIGAIHASRTTWRFGADAIATRAVVASNLTFGMVDSVVTFARWRSDGGAVTLTYLPEGTGTARFDYLLQGTTLILGGIGFERQ